MPKLDGLSLARRLRGRAAGAGGHARRRDDRRRRDACSCARWPTACPDRIDAGGRVEVRGELVMLRSTFAAYNAAHPDKPLINPRNAAAGTIRAKDPADGRRARGLRFFAFDLDTDGRRPRRPRGGAARRSASTPPTCATATTPTRRRR